MRNEKIKQIQEKLKNKTTEEIISWLVEGFGVKSFTFASSFGAEDQVLTDMLAKVNKGIAIFTLDTGRLPQETYDIIEITKKHYGVNIDMLFPEAEAVERMQNEFGPNLFYENVEKRKMCCKVRKIDPLKKKLMKLTAWVTGLRRDQSITRKEINVIEWDAEFGLIKINPLAEWTEEQVWKYIKDNNVPYNKLHDNGYPSIGCAPCTRPVGRCESVRDGRWWWENPEHRECGLHSKK